MQWEYRTVQIGHKKAVFSLGGLIDAEHMNEKLDELGAEGWELAACFETNLYEGATRHVHLIFKRPRSA